MTTETIQQRGKEAHNDPQTPWDTFELLLTVMEKEREKVTSLIWGGVLVIYRCVSKMPL